MNKELFLEIGTEEIPAGFLLKAMSDMDSLIRKELDTSRLTFGSIEVMAAPRRLVLCVKGLPSLQPDSETTALGPAVSIAYTSDGKPSKAAEGFARGQGVDVASLQVIHTEKGDYVAALKKEKGRSVHDLLSHLLPRFISSIPFKKSMRWADFDVRFARPVHWIIALFDGVVVPFSFGPIQSGSVSRGHRFMSDVTFPVSSLSNYLEECERHFVIPDPARRKDIIRREIHRTAEAAGGSLLPDEALLDEVSYLCEYPSVVYGTFSDDFLKVPKEVLVTSMRQHQRYFSVVDNNGKLLNIFITVNNTLTEDPAVVVKGNERVLRARLSDARFFFEEDQKIKLEERVESLKSVVYQQKLGTSFEKMERFRQISVELAGMLNPAAKDKTSRAAFLCKADLLTGMVGEFPEVQGIMGREYALLQGEDSEVAIAIAEHYLPNQAGGSLPVTDAGAFVSIADKIDTICGCFGVNLIPTGSADPYALRRSAIGTINIILDRGYNISLSSLLDIALQGLSEKLLRSRDDVKKDVLEFFRGRLLNLLNDQYPTDAVDAAIAAGYDNFTDMLARVKSLTLFKSREDFSELLTTFKRVVNIVKDAQQTEIYPSMFQDEAETFLYNELNSASIGVAECVVKGDYLKGLEIIAPLKHAVDNFFEKVMVMSEDEQIRNNRLSLLMNIALLFRGIADFSRMSS